MRLPALLILSAAAAVATPAMAMPDRTSPDRTGYIAIAAGDLKLAEQRIAAERRIFPQRPELMLNMAAVYGQTGRTTQARALYVAVLDRPAVIMDLPSGTTASSHDLATRGLSRMAPQMATR